MVWMIKAHGMRCFGPVHSLDNDKQLYCQKMYVVQYGISLPIAVDAIVCTRYSFRECHVLSRLWFRVTSYTLVVIRRCSHKLLAYTGRYEFCTP